MSYFFLISLTGKSRVNANTRSVLSGGCTGNLNAICQFQEQTSNTNRNQAFFRFGFSHTQMHVIRNFFSSSIPILYLDWHKRNFCMCMKYGCSLRQTKPWRHTNCNRENCANWLFQLTCVNRQHMVYKYQASCRDASRETNRPRTSLTSLIKTFDICSVLSFLSTLWSVLITFAIHLQVSFLVSFNFYPHIDLDGIFCFVAAATKLNIIFW